MQGKHLWLRTFSFLFFFFQKIRDIKFRSHITCPQLFFWGAIMSCRLVTSWGGLGVLLRAAGGLVNWGGGVRL